MCKLKIGIKYLHNMCHNKNVKFRNCVIMGKLNVIR
jgi:hypothetical protein